MNLANDKEYYNKKQGLTVHRSGGVFRDKVGNCVPAPPESEKKGGVQRHKREKISITRK